MRKIIFALAMFILMLSGCIPSNPPITETPDQSVSSNPTTGSLFAINAVGLGPDGYVALTNFTDQPANLGGLFLCQGRQCFELPDVDVSPDETVYVVVGKGAGLTQVVATQATIGSLRPSDGEIGLYSSRNVDDPKATLVYLEWGSTPHENTNAAIEAGLWIKGSYAPSAKNATRLFRQDTGLWLFDTK